MMGAIMKAAILPFIIVAVRPQTNCQTGVLDATVRQSIVDQHNRLRSSLTSRAANAAGLSGRNIHALRYDCTLEAQAQAQANRCERRRSSLTSRPEVGENIFAFTGKNQAPGAIALSIMQWWNQILLRPWNGGANNVYTAAVHSTGIDSFAQMAWGSSTRVGCGYTACNGFKSVVCQYITAGPKIGAAVFHVGSGCANNAECTLFPGSTCNTALKLCEAPSDVHPVPVTTTTKVATTAMTTTQAPQSCTESTSLDDNIRATIIEKHNALRTKIAKGASIGAVFLRGCKDMFALKYDCNLERAANVLSDACGNRASVAVAMGRNSMYVNTPGTNALPAAKAVDAALAEWEAQVANLLIDKNIAAAAAENAIAQVGFFAQMAWAKTIKVGCSYAQCSQIKTIVVCMYDPPRADAGQKVYTPVSTKTGCVKRTCAAAVPPNSACNRTTGLCEAP